MADFGGATITVPADPGGLDKAQIAKLLDSADLIDDWLGAVRAHALHLAESGSAIPGYKLVPKRATRKWGENAEAEQVANMNVIASALQLLETLKCAEYTVNVTRACLMDSVETHSTHGGWLHQEAMRLDLELDMIRDSITKATGEQP